MFHTLDMYELKEKPETCPSCGDAEAIRTILYGMPMGPVDDSIYTLGGCVVSKNMPRYLCINCNWSD